MPDCAGVIMADTIIVAIITGGLSLIGVVISSMASIRRMDSNLKISQAVTETKLDELTREVREHNNFARRMPVVEGQIDNINRRIENLERGN